MGFFFLTLVIYVICFYTNLTNMDEKNGNNSLPQQQQENSKRGRGRGRERCNQIPPRTSPITFVIVPTRGVTSMATTIVKGIVMLVGIEARPSCQRQGNWEQVELLTFIQCKKIEHIALKRLIDPWSHM
jgi:hypothetical protein